MTGIIFLLFISVAGESGYKSLGTARLYSAICPGAGKFYVHQYWKGVVDFVVTGGLATGAILSFNAVDGAPEADEAAEGEMSKEDYKILGWMLGIGGLGYYILQIWSLNDDVVVYNFKKRFLESTSLRLNFSPTKCSLLLAKKF